jgi:hypothetical protein
MLRIALVSLDRNLYKWHLFETGTFRTNPGGGQVKGAEDLAELARAFGRIVERIAAREAEPETDGDWVDQSNSPLGARLHCAAVRRLCEEGRRDLATVKNRRHLLTRAALREEMMRSPKPGLRKTTGKSSSPPGGGGTPARSAVALATAAKLRGLRNRGQKA